MSEAATFAWEGGTVSGAWHHPKEGATYLALTHGAGGTMETPSLVAFADAVAERGLGAVRFNLPYAEAGKGSVGPQARNEACWRAVATQVGARAERLLLGGRSYGGRLASHIVADGFDAAGLVFLAYPLHPPGKPEKLRDEHLGRITVPMLFLQGTRDAFADPALLKRTIDRLPNATLHALEGGDHSHRVRGRAEADVVAELAGATVAWLAKPR
jgi:hypothetical protein